MSSIQPFRRRPFQPVVLTLAALLPSLLGCGTSGSTTGTGTGDAGGFRLGAFVSDRNNPPGQTDLYLWDYDAKSFRNLPAVVRSTAAERHPTLSSDGRFIAFQINRGGGGGDDIEMYDRARSTFVDLPGLNTGLDETEPVFTGDGLKLCFVQGSPRRIRFYNGQTKLLEALPGLDTTGVGYNDYSPAPNRDGSLIAFVSDRTGSPDIYVWSRLHRGLIDGPKLHQALVSAGEDLDPSFSQNGRFLTFTSDRAGGQGVHDLYLLEFVSSLSVNDTLLRDVHLANSPSDERHPGVSDNGAILVFQSDRAGGLGRWDLWNFDRNSGDPPGQALGYDSVGDEIEPSIKWPY